MKIQKFFQTSCLFFLLFALPPTVTAAEVVPAPLPPEAREAFDEGLVAARQ